MAQKCGTFRSGQNGEKWSQVEKNSWTISCRGSKKGGAPEVHTSYFLLIWWKIEVFKPCRRRSWWACPGIQLGWGWGRWWSPPPTWWQWWWLWWRWWWRWYLPLLRRWRQWWSPPRRLRSHSTFQDPRSGCSWKKWQFQKWCWWGWNTPLDYSRRGWRQFPMSLNWRNHSVSGWSIWLSFFRNPIGEHKLFDDGDASMMLRKRILLRIRGSHLGHVTTRM